MDESPGEPGFLVTPEAELFQRSLQKIAIGRIVKFMTFSTLSLFHWLMNTGSIHFLSNFSVTPETQPGRPLFQIHSTYESMGTMADFTVPSFYRFMHIPLGVLCVHVAVTIHAFLDHHLLGRSRSTPQV